MLCSEEELGIGSDNTGIMILPSELTPGQDLMDALDLRDTVLDIGITPKPVRLFVHHRCAREVRGRYGPGNSAAGIIFRENEEDINAITSSGYGSRISVAVHGPGIQHVTIKPSPAWIRRRLSPWACAPSI